VSSPAHTNPSSPDRTDGASFSGPVAASCPRGGAGLHMECAMAREVLPIVGAAVGGYFGPRLSWWRRALLGISRGIERLAYLGAAPGVVNWGWSGCALVGQSVDPERFAPASEWTGEPHVPEYSQ
jgi:hypothetical protein